jgi:hypothetical protein
MVRVRSGRLLAISDLGDFLDFARPGAPAGPARIGPVLELTGDSKSSRDIESATYDPASGWLWMGFEGLNAIARTRTDFSGREMVQPAAMRNWPGNRGPEAMVRLADGRFVVLSEAYTSWTGSRLHEALLFPGDPVAGAQPQRFTFAGAEGYRPTDMAQLPDGRVLILMRRLRWPLPPLFADKIVIADPAEIRPDGIWRAVELTDIAAPAPVDNYEALTIEPGPDGKLLAWIMSDDNRAATQATYLLKLEFRMTDLPPKQKARG